MCIIKSRVTVCRNQSNGVFKFILNISRKGLVTSVSYNEMVLCLSGARYQHSNQNVLQNDVPVKSLLPNHKFLFWLPNICLKLQHINFIQLYLHIIYQCLFTTTLKQVFPDVLNLNLLYPFDISKHQYCGYNQLVITELSDFHLLSYFERWAEKYREN